MRLGSPLPHKKARIEIIPLIDIMFFLLASFMMVSLSMIRMQSIKMNLPTAQRATNDIKPDMLTVRAIDAAGQKIDEFEIRKRGERPPLSLVRGDANGELTDSSAWHAAVR